MKRTRIEWRILRDTTINAVVCVGLGVGIGVYSEHNKRIGNHEAAPRTTYSAPEDLNRDGTPDTIAEQGNGHKVPLYGMREGQAIIYVSAAEITRRRPGIHPDYGAIENGLNK